MHPVPICMRARSHNCHKRAQCLLEVAMRIQTIYSLTRKITINSNVLATSILLLSFSLWQMLFVGEKGDNRSRWNIVERKWRTKRTQEIKDGMKTFLTFCWAFVSTWMDAFYTREMLNVYSRWISRRTAITKDFMRSQEWNEEKKSNNSVGCHTRARCRRKKFAGLCAIVWNAECLAISQVERQLMWDIVILQLLLWFAVDSVKFRIE